MDDYVANELIEVFGTMIPNRTEVATATPDELREVGFHIPDEQGNWPFIILVNVGPVVGITQDDVTSKVLLDMPAAALLAAIIKGNYEQAGPAIHTAFLAQFDQQMQRVRANLRKGSDS